MSHLTRRELLKSGGAAAALTLASESVQYSAAAQDTEVQPSQSQSAGTLRIVVAGGHPGDPEAGCGGTMARYTQLGHEVTALYLTRGEAGITGKTTAQAAAIRTAEAEQACKILKATPTFASQIDAATEVNPTRTADFARLIAKLNPDVLFTQWPIDTHPDHRACASLTLGAWLALGRKFSLLYYEVDLGSDTQCFHPTCYVNVTEVESLKRDACLAHASQNPQKFYNGDHIPMMRFRGTESGTKLAEAFIHHDQSPFVLLPAK
jgi:LmbE family N-acetylglucosaminyl deacetylase